VRDQGRVLVVTDDSKNSHYRSLLEKNGLTMIPAANSAGALVAIRRSRPQVIVVETNVKGVSTEELSRMLFQTRDGAPFILVGAAEATTARRKEAFDAGAFDYFQVPAEHSLLVARLAQLVSMRQGMERLRAEADKDYLTGLANRRRFRYALGHEVERWRRYRLPCALVLLDVDYLKKINDTYGHSAGDVVIRHVAGALTQFLRENDTAARLGGEEFALLLAGADTGKAFAAAERVRLAVGATPLPNIGNVSISLGVSVCPDHAESERALYGASDAALYQAKREGRNRTIIATPFAENADGDGAQN
jgi:diguanylate cyclase (GGDEF)-like protein